METSDCENESPQITTDVALSPKTPKFSPPYKRIRALRLFNNDAHHNPKALRSCSTSLYSKFLQVSPLRVGPQATLFNDQQNNNNNRSKDANLPLPSVNINPFSPEGAQLSASQKWPHKQLPPHCGSPELTTQQHLNTSLNVSSDSCDLDIIDTSNTSSSSKRELRDSNISRYHEEFHDVELIGTGQFASVYKCINRLDGCVYAVKKSTRPVIGGAAANLALKEVYAHAVLGCHPHVVRYYSAWLENDHMIIQNEYCNGGSLQDKLHGYGHGLELWDLRRLLRQVAEGLRFIHASGLVHLDIKPSNIFVSRERRSMLYVDPYDSADDMEQVANGGAENGGGGGGMTVGTQEVYKIGDLGHVASARAAANAGGGSLTVVGSIEEGDCRYLAVEILREDYTLLPASDIFSLGITALEAADVCRPLPKEGDEWHQLRAGTHPQQQPRQHLPEDLTQLIWQMMQPSKELRPSAACVVQHGAVQPEGCKSRAQLYRELNAEKVKNDFLQKQMLEVVSRRGRPPAGATGRLVGGKGLQGAPLCNRSNSTTNF